MILVDQPYISEFFKETVVRNAFPVVNTEAAKAFGWDQQTRFLDEAQVARYIESQSNLRVYTTSENTLTWINKNLHVTGLPEKIQIFKDKARLRRLLQPIYPDFYFREVALTDLADFNESIPFPVVIKPTVGFFSLNVYSVSNRQEWENVKTQIFQDVEQTSDIFPQEVFSPTRFLIEQQIEGDEFAMDVYFNSRGKPVILNILQHLFASHEDVSDRVYVSSKDIIVQHLSRLESFLVDIGQRADLKDFPMHVEVRISQDGKVLPIEINPMRFGGWCTTADMANYAWGFNAYEYYFYDREPDWHSILAGKDRKLFSIIVLGNSTGIDSAKITSFDYERLLTTFEKPLELIKTDYKQYPVFGFLFTETSDESISELESILESDLKEFIAYDP